MEQSQSKSEAVKINRSNGRLVCPHESCTLTYGNRDALHDHCNQAHKKVKPYGCSACTMRCVRRRNAERHIRGKHQGVEGPIWVTGKRPANCEACRDVTYTSLKALLPIDGKTPKATTPAGSQAPDPSEPLQEHNSFPFLNENTSSASSPDSLQSVDATAVTTATDGAPSPSAMSHPDLRKSLAFQTMCPDVGTVRHS